MNNVAAVLCMALCSPLQYVAGDEIASLRDSLLDICGGTLDSVPLICVLDADAFRAQRINDIRDVTGKGDAAQLERLPHASMFFRAASNTIFKRRGSSLSETAALNSEEIEILRDMELVHELTHAWQDKNLPPRTAWNGSAFVASVLCEGHAQFCARCFCKRKGTLKVFDRIESAAAELRRTIFPLTEVDSYFVYFESCHFFVAISQQDPPLTNQDVVAKPLPTERQIIFPAEYLAGTCATAPDLTPLRDAIFGAGDHVAVDASELGYVGLRAYLRQCKCSDKRISPLLNAFRGGMRYASGIESASVLAYDSVSCAKEAFDVALRDHSVRSKQVLAEVPLIAADGVGYTYYELQSRNTDDQITTLLVPRAACVRLRARAPHFVSARRRRGVARILVQTLARGVWRQRAFEMGQKNRSGVGETSGHAGNRRSRTGSNDADRKASGSDRGRHGSPSHKSG